MESDKYLMSVIDVYEEIAEIQQLVYDNREVLDSRELNSIYEVLEKAENSIKEIIVREIKDTIKKLELLPELRELKQEKDNLRKKMKEVNGK